MIYEYHSKNKSNPAKEQEITSRRLIALQKDIRYQSSCRLAGPRTKKISQMSKCLAYRRYFNNLVTQHFFHVAHSPTWGIFLRLLPMQNLFVRVWAAIKADPGCAVLRTRKCFRASTVRRPCFPCARKVSQLFSYMPPSRTNCDVIFSYLRRISQWDIILLPEAYDGRTLAARMMSDVANGLFNFWLRAKLKSYYYVR